MVLSLLSTSNIYTNSAHENSAFKTLSQSAALDTVTILSTLSNAGIIGGNGIYKAGTKIKLTASTKVGFEFLGWTEKDTVISKDSIYSFIVSTNRIIIANFIYL